MKTTHVLCVENKIQTHNQRKQSVGSEFVLTPHSINLRIDHPTWTTAYTNIEEGVITELRDRNGKLKIQNEEPEELRRYKDHKKYVKHLWDEFKKIGVNRENLFDTCNFYFADPGVNVPLEIVAFFKRMVPDGKGGMRQADFNNREDYVHIPTWTKKQFYHKCGKNANRMYWARRGKGDETNHSEHFNNATSTEDMAQCLEERFSDWSKLSKNDRDRLSYQFMKKMSARDKFANSIISAMIEFAKNNGCGQKHMVLLIGDGFFRTSGPTFDVQRRLVHQSTLIS